MPIAALLWFRDAGGRIDASRDRHLLRTQTSDSLISGSNLVFAVPGESDPVPAADYFSTRSDVDVDFRPLFRAVDAGTRYSGFGIHVDKATGAVSFDAGPRATSAPRNFLIEVSVTRNVGGPAIDPLLIRIHAHETVARFWLTPSELTVHRQAASGTEKTPFRFGARAEFDDGTLGDVTVHHGIAWSDHADDEGFVTLQAVDTAPGQVDVVATAPPVWGVPAAKGKVKVEAPWATLPPPEAVFVTGDPMVSATPPATPQATPNVLFLGTGFPAVDGPDYVTMITALCHRARRDPLTRPFDLLAASMNFWRLQVPSGTRGLPVRCEVYLRNTVGGGMEALPVGGVSKPPSAGTWDVSHLRYAVGLPLPEDRERLPKPLRDEFVARADGAFALALFDPVVVPDQVLLQWRAQARRTLIEDVDLFPSLAVGLPPSAMNDAFSPKVFLHHDRGNEETLDDYLKLVVADKGVTLTGGTPVGVLWTTGQAFQFDNRKFLILLGATTLGRAINTGTGIHLVLEGRPAARVLFAQAGTKAVRLDLPPEHMPFQRLVNRRILDLWRVAAHEIMHSFELGDEYADTAQTFDDNVADTAVLAITPNVQPLAAVTSGGAISGDLIKWRWPRIRKAAVINVPLPASVPPGGTFIAHVDRPDGFLFEKNDRVRIRLRVRGIPLLQTEPTALVSTEFIVTNVSGVGDALTLQNASSGLLVQRLDRFTPGSLVFQPVDPPSPIPPDYPYAELLPRVVRQQINTTHRPLTPSPCDPDAEQRTGGEIQIPSIDFSLPLLWSGRHRSRIVGLYSNGNGYACGVFHPTGLCMMRNHLFNDGFHEFCAVCRYALVDLIDPAQHGPIEEDLARRTIER